MPKKSLSADLSEAPRTSAEWEVVVARLEAERAALAERDAAAVIESRPLALDAALGKPNAAARLGEVNALRTALARDLDNLIVALEDACGRLDAARDAEAEASRAERLAQARAIAGQIVEASAEIDALFGRVQAVFERRQGLIAALRPLGQLDTTRFKRLRNPVMHLAAMSAAGLHDFLPIQRLQSGHWQTLATWDGKVLAGLLAPTGVAPPAEAPQLEEVDA